MFRLYISIFLLATAALAQNLTLTNAEYFWDSDPGIGNGTPITLDNVNTDSAFATFGAPAGNLPAGMHRLFVRYLDSEGVWSRAEGRYIYIFSPIIASYQPRTITQAQYHFDNLAPVTIDVADSSFATLAQEISTEGLEYGIHRLFIQYQNDDGTWSANEGRYIAIFQPWNSNFQPGLVTQAEYRFDNLPPVTIDVPDSGRVNIAELASTEGLDLGLHTLSIRYLDNHGVWSASEGRYVYIVTPQPPPFVSDHLIGGEYWVETDPGIGNGTPLAVSDDSAAFYADGFTLGAHIIGVRFYDAFGVWTMTIQDTVIAGPVLMIHRSGNSMVLYWVPSDSVEGRPFHIWRALQSEGPFTEVDTTSNVNWTDTDILNSPDKHFYYIRQTVPAP